jgi:hypothetical protein
MDTFEKQQRIDVINGIIKVRWFIASIIIGVGFILKLKYFGVGWGVGFGTDIFSAYLKIGIFGAIVFVYNFIFWFFMRSLGRQPLEKISDRFLIIMSALQIIPDQLMFAVDFYFVGTVDTMAFMYFFLSLLFAGSLYKNRGIVLTGIMAGFLFTFICVIEYIGLIPHLPTYQSVTFFGNLYILRAKIASFISYIGIVTIASVFLSNLIRNREQKLRQERDKVTEQSQFLTVQTQELTKTKDYLHEALTKSDAARVETEKTKTELQKANLELQAKLSELEKYGRVTTGRELKMIELKDKIKTLEKRIEELEKK